MNDTRTKCPNCGAFDELSEPHLIEIALNHLGRRGFVEQLWNSHSLPIFRQDLVDLWRSNALTGFNTKPVSIIGWFDMRKRDLPRSIPIYSRLVTVSKVRLTEPAPRNAPCIVCDFVDYAFPKIGTRLPNGIRIDLATWDGADIFGVKGYEFVFFSRRAAELTLEAGFSKNIAFVRLEDWQRWEQFDVKKWTPREYSSHVEKFLVRRTVNL